MDLFTAELKTAISITSQTATSITFVVPDRNGDGQNETINYAWLSAGTALKRTYNGGVGIEVIEALQGFTVTPVSRTNSPLAPVESAEFQLLNNEAVTLSVVSPTTTDYFAQYFNPQRNLPWNTLTWKLTRMQLYCTWPTTSGTFTYEIYAADAAKKPTGAVLASTTFAMSNSLLGQWVNINVADLPGLVPGSGLVLVVKSTATTLLDDAHVPVKTGMTPSAAMASYESTDSGSTWGTRDQTKNAIFRVYGTVITQP